MFFDIFKKKKSGLQPQNELTHNLANNGKPRAVAFVDYEHWYIALENIHHQKPDIKAWRAELTSKYDVSEIIFFADFSNPSLRGEISRIREVTNVIIETGNTSARYKKDFTDFIMLDHIYQKAMSAGDIDAFIIFTGDGHFSSVVSFITTRLGKPVIIYAVRDALSGQLKSTASAAYEIPVPDEKFISLARLIFGNLKFLDEQNKQKSRKSLPTFWGTVDAVARYNRIPKNEVSDAMRELIDRGYIYQTEQIIEPKADKFRSQFSKQNSKNNIDSGIQTEQNVGEKSVKVLNVKWDKVVRDGLCAKE